MTDAVLAAARAGLEPQAGTGRPVYAGVVVLAGCHGEVTLTAALGDALKYADATAELPAEAQLPMRPDTIFDVASLSKLFTAICAAQLVERGLLELDAPVAGYLPAFAAYGKESVTVRQLLTHTSGLPAWLPLYREPDDAARLAATCAVPPLAPAGASYLYADLNLITLGAVLELIGGSTLDRLVRDGITEPLGMTETMYNPPAALRPRIAATEWRPGEGMTWGTVHDENAAAFGGVAGHAGVFSTASDLAILARAVLARESTRSLLTEGLGFQRNRPEYMGRLASPRTAGHTGFTGTSIVIDARTDSFLIVLSNRVHPSRDWSQTQINPRRALIADEFARAMRDRAAATPG